MDAKAQEKLDRSGLSITDPCLGWEQTVAVLEEMAGFRKKLSYRGRVVTTPVLADSDTPFIKGDKEKQCR